jgi:hypothetical protein
MRYLIMIACTLLLAACGDMGPVAHHAPDHCPPGMERRGLCEPEPEPPEEEEDICPDGASLILQEEAMAPLSVTSTGGSPHRVELEDGTVVSEHVREDKAVEAAANASAERGGETVYVRQGKELRVALTCPEPEPEPEPEPDPEEEEDQDPGQVTDLEAVSATHDAVTLRWTQVDDGTGEPAKYALRYGTPTIGWADAYPTEVSIEGTEIGVPLEYEYGGLDPETAYEFRMVAYRGTLNDGAVFGSLSNIAEAVTQSESGEEEPDPEPDPEDPPEEDPEPDPEPEDPEEDPDVGAPAFYDGFESGDLSHEENGFRWGSVAGQPWHRDHEQNPDSPQNNVGIDAPVYRGDWALHIRMVKDRQQNQYAQLRGPKLQEFWFEYRIRIPVADPNLNLKGTYDHTPRDGPHNNKWVEFFSSRPDLLVWSEMFPNNAEDGGSRLTFNATGTHTSGSHSTATQQGVVVPNDLGRWVRFRYHVRLTTLDANTVETFYEIWRDGSYLGSDTREIPTSEENHWIDRFQILGWNNHEWPELIRWFIDEVRIYTQNPGWEK